MTGGTLPSGPPRTGGFPEDNRHSPSHGQLAALLHAFGAAGLALERFAEGGGPAPVMLAVRARKTG
jgi:hypothetical protein